MENFEQQVNKIIDRKLDSMTNMSTGNHAHNGYDVNQLDPAIALLGFPVLQVADATATPTDTPVNGTFRFYVDTTPHYRLWAYLNYQTVAGVLTPKWVVVSLT
jgi:hypothetical protein